MHWHCLEQQWVPPSPPRLGLWGGLRSHGVAGGDAGKWGPPKQGVHVLVLTAGDARGLP